MNRKNIRMIISNMKNIQSGERTGALGLEQKLSEVMVMIDLANMIMKALKMNNLREDKFIDLENLEKVKTAIRMKLMMMIPLIDKSLIPKQVSQLIIRRENTNQFTNNLNI